MNLLEGVAIGVVALGGVWMSVGLFQEKTPAPEYEVLGKINATECRFYPSITMVLKTQETDNQAFRQLFKYISGDNSRNEKIPMTAPVLTGDSSENAHNGLPQNNWLGFIMPENLKVPTPNNNQLETMTFSGLTVLVQRFSGYPSPAQVQEITQYMTADAEKLGKEPIASPMVAQYDPPYIFPMFRKNEVWLPVKDSK